MTKENQPSEKKESALPGFALLCLIVVGLCGILHAFVTRDGSGLIASAIAFGVVAHVAYS